MKPALTFLLRGAATVALLMTFSGCTRTVTWEEEVPLNTGETIWIERTMPWELLGGMGNPFDIAMWPTREQTIRFTYRSQTYVYVGTANVTWIAVSPISRQPVLVAPAADFAWDKENHFYCVVPHYVQLVPDATGRRWTWPPQIEPWLYELPANVMGTIPALDEDRKRRYTRTDRDHRDAGNRIFIRSITRIDAQYKENGCVMAF